MRKPPACRRVQHLTAPRRLRRREAEAGIGQPRDWKGGDSHQQGAGQGAERDCSALEGPRTGVQPWRRGGGGDAQCMKASPIHDGCWRTASPSGTCLSPAVRIARSLSEPTGSTAARR